MVLFLFGVGLIILGTSWGESTYAWDSTQVLVTVIVGGLLSGIFVLYEYLLEDGRLLGRLLPRQSPMIPMSLFSRKDTFVVAVIQFSAGAGEYFPGHSYSGGFLRSSGSQLTSSALQQCTQCFTLLVYILP